MKLTDEFLKKNMTLFSKEKLNTILLSEIAENGIASVLFHQNESFFPVNFDVCLPQHSAANQGISGRCWIYAGLNCLRYTFEKKYGTIKLSARYLYFYDLLEKANFFLDYIIRTIDKPLDDRELQYFLSKPIQDPGQWTMFCQLVEKYGVIPEEAMPENITTQDTRTLISFLSDKLRVNAYILRDFQQEDIKALEFCKEEMLSDIYTILSFCIGEPPVQITYPSDLKEILSPIEFQKKYFSLHSEEYVSVVHTTDAEASNYELLNVGNLVEGLPIRYYSLPLDKMKKAVMKQIADGFPVWFGCDTKICFDRENGIMDLRMFDFENFLQLPRDMPKDIRLDYHISSMNHAMVLVGYSLHNGSPNLWCVENSVGELAGRQGYCVMTNQWFEQYVFQVVLKKEYLDEELSAILNKPFKKLAPWSPLSSLALLS